MSEFAIDKRSAVGAPDEIEITQAMIDAGADAMAGQFFDLLESIGYREIAGIVFEAMAAKSEKPLLVRNRSA
jgi:hypothetical protein